jgi:hypothetical protein
MVVEITQTEQLCQEFENLISDGFQPLKNIYLLQCYAHVQETIRDQLVLINIHERILLAPSAKDSDRLSRRFFQQKKAYEKKWADWAGDRDIILCYLTQEMS